MRRTLTTSRRNVLLAGGAIALAGAVAVGRKWRELQQHAYTTAAGIPVKAPEILATVGAIPGARLSSASPRRVLEVQDTLDVGNRRSLKGLAKGLLGRT